MAAMDHPDAKAEAEAQHLALLAEHLLARAAYWDAAGGNERQRAEGLRQVARRACVKAMNTLAAGDSTTRHSRDGGNAGKHAEALGSRLRGNDEAIRLRENDEASAQRP